MQYFRRNYQDRSCEVWHLKQFLQYQLKYKSYSSPYHATSSTFISCKTASYCSPNTS